MTLDQAIELLEITEDIDKISEKDLNNKRRRAMGRWHPDTVATADAATQARYERNFKNIETAVQIIYQYRTGTYFAGQEFEQRNSKSDGHTAQDENNIRSQASRFVTDIRQVWQQIRNSGWGMNIRETILSDGFRLRDVLRQDIKDDVMAISVTSLFYGFYGFLALCIPALFLPYVLFVTFPVFLIHSLLCLLLILPLSRLWMPTWLIDAAVFSCNKGLVIGDIIMKTFGRWRFFRALVNWPFYFAKGMTLLFITPLYELTGYLLREKVVGIKKRRERYLNDYPELYIEQLLQKDTLEMSWLELRHLSDLHRICIQFNTTADTPR